MKVKDKMFERKTFKRIAFDLPVDLYNKLDEKAEEASAGVDFRVSKKDIVVLALEELFEKEEN